MVSGTDLTLFAHVVGRPDDDLNLAQAALLIAEPEYPGLDIPHYTAMLDRFGKKMRGELAGTEAGVPSAQKLLTVVYEELGFAGNLTDYYDPKNSFLNEVLDRRTGIPISLAIVVLEIASRAGLPVAGVGFPGHFLLRMEAPGGLILIDPFHGRLLDADDLRELYTRVIGEPREPDPETLKPTGKIPILLRVLANLRGIYGEGKDPRRLRAVLERMVVLAPEDDELRGELVALGGDPPPPRSGHGIN
jgi:regulator of sirC expression with transglutaminase-like and TPR domain